MRFGRCLICTAGRLKTQGQTRLSKYPLQPRRAFPVATPSSNCCCADCPAHHAPPRTAAMPRTETSTFCNDPQTSGEKVDTPRHQRINRLTQSQPDDIPERIITHRFQSQVGDCRVQARDDLRLGIHQGAIPVKDDELNLAGHGLNKMGQDPRIQGKSWQLKPVNNSLQLHPAARSHIFSTLALSANSGSAHAAACGESRVYASPG